MVYALLFTKLDLNSAFSQGLGAVLEQNGHAVAYYSRSECLAIVKALKRFRRYLLGRKFQILTDHKPLEWLANQKSIGRLWRWAVIRMVL